MSEVPFGFSSPDNPKVIEQVVLAKDNPVESDKPFPDGMYI